MREGRPWAGAGGAAVDAEGTAVGGCQRGERGLVSEGRPRSAAQAVPSPAAARAPRPGGTCRFAASRCRRGGRGRVPEGRTVTGRNSSSRQAMPPRGQRVWSGGRGQQRGPSRLPHVLLATVSSASPSRRWVPHCSLLRRAMPPRGQRMPEGRLGFAARAVAGRLTCSSPRRAMPPRGQGVPEGRRGLMPAGRPRSAARAVPLPAAARTPRPGGTCRLAASECRRGGRGRVPEGRPRTDAGGAAAD